MPEFDLTLTVRVSVTSDDPTVRVLSVVPVGVPTLQADEEEKDQDDDEEEDMIPDDVRRLIAQHASPTLAGYELDFTRKCIQRIGLQASPPLTGTRIDINLWPPHSVGWRRAAAFYPPSGRVHINCTPEQIKGRDLAEPIVESTGRVTGVKVYLRSAEAVELAVELTLRAAQEQ
jgi:hypothetical protein